jgi:uncharacterized protein YktB (UPF0637 family)
MTMAFEGFAEEDFETFELDEFEARMSTIKERIRPKLEQLGELLAPWLEAETGLEFHDHVATHARRRVNAPDATWVALGRNSRGYKKYAHFEVGIDLQGLYVDFFLKGKAEDKPRFTQQLESRSTAFLEQTQSGEFDVEWRSAHGADGAVSDRPLDSMEDPDVEVMVERLRSVKSSEVDIGIGFERDEVLSLSPEEQLEQLKKRLLQLLPVYEAAVGV